MRKAHHYYSFWTENLEAKKLQWNIPEIEVINTCGTLTHNLTPQNKKEKKKKKKTKSNTRDHNYSP